MTLITYNTEDDEMKTIAIMQPTYMPWLGYFSMIDQVDEFVFLDNVQLVNRSWQVRNKIKCDNEAKMLTIPVNKEKHRDERFIYNTSYFGEDWKKSHLGIIRYAYSKANYYNQVMPLLEDLYSYNYKSIGDMTSSFIVDICKRIGIDTPFLYSKDLYVEGHKDALLVDICRKRNAEAYLSAQGSSSYIEADTPAGEIGKAGIELYYMNYEHPKYEQIGNCFVPYIGIYDLLFNAGFDTSLEIIRSGQRKNYTSEDYRRLYIRKA